MTTKLLNIKTRLFRSLTNLGMMIILFSCSSSSIGEEPINPPAPPASSVEKSEYYVSTTGNDENPGTLTSPWRTIQKAVTTVTPGCVVNIMGGTYYEEIKVTVSGTTDKYIVIKNYNDEEVIISGDNKPRELMNLNGVSYIKVKGLTFADCLGSYSVGIKISTTSDEASHHIEIESNTIRNLYANATATVYPPNVYAGGITVAGYLDSKAIHDIIIRENTVKDCRTGWTEAISVTGNVDGFLITKNVVTNTGNIGIDASGHWGISKNPAGLTAHLGTTDVPVIIKSIEEGDKKAEFVLDAMIYNVAKAIGGAATVLCGKIDAILLTGGIAYSDYVISRLKKRISFLAPIHIYPGENEMESLAFNALGALKGELPIEIYK